jgi:arginyl-tRNA synthetase
LRTIYRFPEIVGEAAKTYSPNLLCNFLFDLAQKFNLFYEKERIIGSDNEEFRLLLTAAVGQVLKNGLNLLGIIALERM